MKISVVTISYNQAKYIRQCIDSVLSQSYPNFEYIIVDPGSTDGSREIIGSYGDNVIKCFEDDNGPADGLNRGFSFATGDLYYFINSDDFLLPNAFSNAISEFNADPEFDVLLGAGVEVDELGRVNRHHFPSRVSSKAYVNGAVTLFQQGMFFRSEVYKRFGPFNPSNRTSWDGELLLRFLICGARFRRSMKRYAAFRIYPDSITGSQRLSELFKVDKNRLYEMVYGPGAQFSIVNGIFYRVAKLLLDPIYIFYKFFW